jgi:energy-coupling factor transporter ATP-binding protein EcfA2
MAVADLSGRALRGTRRDRALFVDREKTLDAVRQTLHRRGNVLLLGTRGSGKSSFLRLLRRELEESGERVVMVEGRVASSAADFLALLRDHLDGSQQAEGTGSSTALAVVGTERERPPKSWPGSPDTQTLLNELADLRAQVTNQETLVLVDELPSPEAARTLFGRLRDELWELPLTWCAAADERDRGTYTEPPADAFWRRIFVLEPLSAADSAELLRRRLSRNELSEEALRQIVGEAEGNPRRLLSLAYDVAVEGRAPEDVIARRRRQQERWTTLSEPAQRLLAELEANGPASPSDRGLLQRLGWSRSRASQVFSELENHDLVRATTRPGSGTRPRRVFEIKL